MEILQNLMDGKMTGIIHNQQIMTIPQVTILVTIRVPTMILDLVMILAPAMILRQVTTLLQAMTPLQVTTLVAVVLTLAEVAAASTN